MSRAFPFALALLLAPAMASAQPAATTAPSAAALSPKARALVEVLSSRAEYEQQFTANFMSAFDRSLKQNGGAAAMEAKMPGLIKAMRDALTQEVVRQLPNEYDHYMGALGALYQATLTDAEMDTTIAFYRSPTGQRMIARARAAALASVNKLAENGQLKDTKSAIENVTGDAMIASIQDLSQDDMKALMAFSAQPGTIKLAQTQPKISALAAEESQASIARLTATFRTVTDKVMAQYIAQK